MRKLRQQHGFTIVETLLICIILLMIGAGIASGTRFATVTFTRSVSISEAEILGSTLKTLISEELRNTETIEVKNGSVRAIYSKNYGLAGSSSSAFGAWDPELDEEAPDGIGYITLGGKKILSAAAYTYGTRASVDIKYSAPPSCYSVELTIYDKQKTAVKTYKFDVLPVIEPIVY